MRLKPLSPQPPMYRPAWSKIPNAYSTPLRQRSAPDSPQATLSAIAYRSWHPGLHRPTGSSHSIASAHRSCASSLRYGRSRTRSDASVRGLTIGASDEAGARFRFLRADKVARRFAVVAALLRVLRLIELNREVAGRLEERHEAVAVVLDLLSELHAERAQLAHRLNDIVAEEGTQALGLRRIEHRMHAADHRNARRAGVAASVPRDESFRRPDRRCRASASRPSGESVTCTPADAQCTRSM